MKENIEQEARNIVEKNFKNGTLDLAETDKDLFPINTQPMTGEERVIFLNAFSQALMEAHGIKKQKEHGNV